MTESNILEVIRECYRKVLPNKLKIGQKLTMLGLVTVLVLFFQGDRAGFSLENIRMALVTFLNLKLGKSSLWERLASRPLSNALIFLMKKLMANLVVKSMRGAKLLKKLKISKIVMIDSSTISLWDCVAKIFPGTWTTAGIKLHACFNVMDGKMEWCETSPSSESDHKHFPNINIFVKGTLFLFDLGYWDYKLLFSIDLAKSYFLSRVKSNATVKIIDVVKGISSSSVGRDLFSICFKKNRGNVIEFIGGLTNKGIEKSFRVFGFWNPESKSYHWYISNLKIEAVLIYSLYRLRWQTELLFKTAKNRLNLKKIPSGNEQIINNLIVANICAYLTSISIIDISIPELDEEQSLAISFQRVGRIFKTLAIDFMNAILKSKKYVLVLKDKIKNMSSELYDPNYKHRPTNLLELSNST
jgi:hypothetical protein